MNAEALADQVEIVQSFKSKAYFIAAIMSTEEFRMLLLTAYDEGMLNGDYIFYGADLKRALLVNPTYRPNISNSLLFEGVLCRSQIEYSGTAWQQLREDTVQAFTTNPVFADYQHQRPYTPDDVSSYAGTYQPKVI